MKSQLNVDASLGVYHLQELIPIVLIPQAKTPEVFFRNRRLRRRFLEKRRKIATSEVALIFCPQIQPPRSQKPPEFCSKNRQNYDIPLRSFHFKMAQIRQRHRVRRSPLTFGSIFHESTSFPRSAAPFRKCQKRP
jgi:hypothetical protein